MRATRLIGVTFATVCLAIFWLISEIPGKHVPHAAVTSVKASVQMTCNQASKPAIPAHTQAEMPATKNFTFLIP